jgi:predicted RNA polymerase sigma factor
VVQEALLAAWRQWPQDGIPDRPGPWLWTVARRRATDLLRRDVRYRERLSAASFPVSQADEDDSARTTARPEANPDQGLGSHKIAVDPGSAVDPVHHDPPKPEATTETES